MLDHLDRKILSLLQLDGRMANKEIAANVGLVPSATSERLKKLRERGYIRSIEARLEPARVDFGMLAFVFVRTDEPTSGSETGHVLAKIPEVQEVFNVAGEDCYLIKVRTRDAKSLSHLLREKVGRIKSVMSTRTTIVLESYKETCALPIVENGNGTSKPER
jgi:Lrp/AsnC family leucine-responsive transcriptional regulator